MNKRRTYCNPLSLPDIPRGKDEWYPFERGMFSHENKPESVTTPDYRSISDPTVFYYDNKWYLYPSYGMAWVTEDFVNWEHVRTEPYCPKYSPCITPWKGKFLLTAWKCPLYVGDTPVGPFTELGEFIMPDGGTFTPCDPCIFTDDDGRIYLYAYTGRPRPERPKNMYSRTIGYELDRDDPRKVIRGPVTVIEQNTHEHEFERYGANNQDEEFGWIEGPHMLKHNGRYYMIYAAPDTNAPNYCMGVYYSDSDPLSGFVYQKKNPLTIHKEGIVKGAGHGCVEHGPGGNLWAFYTIIANSTYQYERRIGMDLVDVDENGELFCPNGVTDTPQYAPTAYTDKTLGKNSTGDLCLTAWFRPIPSSQKECREAFYASDESSITWWQPTEDDGEPCLTYNLCATYQVCASRIWWKDVGLEYAKGIVPGPIKYIIEGCDEGEAWFTLVDRRDLAEDRNIDYCDFDRKVCQKVRIRITEWPKGITPAIIDFSVFGRRYVKE